MCTKHSFPSAIEDFEVLGTSTHKSDPNNPNLSWEDYASKYLEYTDAAPTVYHAVDFLTRELEREGFQYISERDPWDDALKTGSKFYTTRNGTSFVAFVRGKNWVPGNGAVITGTHTDSLCAVLKPSSKRQNVDGYELLGVAPYAGALSSTWWDRDLGLGGRLIVRDGNKITTKLVRIPHPIARIPTLAPHFGAPANGPFNLETQAVPIVGLVPESQELKPTEDEKQCPIFDKHSLRLLRALSKYGGVPVKDILEFDLQLYDTQPACFGGLDKEFLFCPRLDDKLCSYVAVHGLIESSPHLETGDTLTIVAGYDNEEIGSLTRAGARGNLLELTVDRILETSTASVSASRFYANSFFLSADVLHAVNPNFKDVYLEHHKPHLNVGITLARDPNGHMITDGVTTAFVNEVARRSGDTIQQFQIRNDSRSGGTIGPALAAKTGLRGVDLGIPQLSMHSIRAATGSKDIWLGVRFFKNFNELWREVDLEFKLGQL